MIPLIEACVETLEQASAAEDEGADRIELCADLDSGGTTPDLSLLRTVLRGVRIPVFPIIRPRGGDFHYDATECRRIRDRLRSVRDLGVPGAVIGALADDGRIDITLISALRWDAPDMRLTFHRAFDRAAEPIAALQTVIDIGIDRVLTSGGAATAWDGRETLARLVDHAVRRIEIIAGGSVDARHAAELVRLTGVRELHFRATVPGRVRAIREALEASPPLEGLSD